MPSGWLGVAYQITSTASSLTSLGFGVAKASTKLGFSIARGIASVTPIPLLTTSLNHLESLSLLPILLGESITSTSLTAASTSLDAISNLLDAGDEASFSLASFVTLVRSEWAEHEAAGRSVAEVARAVAAWAAIQGFTKQWSEERWLNGIVELKKDDFRPPEKSKGSTGSEKPRRQRAISRVSVTDDVIMPGRFSQIVSADIGEKETLIYGTSLASTSSSSASIPSQSGLPAPYRSNYETWKTLRRLSKMVLAGYGGAGLIFFGAPLQPDKSQPSHAQSSSSGLQALLRTDSEVKDSEEGILVHVVEDAEAEAMSPPLRNVPLPDSWSFESSTLQHRAGIINPTQEPSPVTPSSSYSWWNVLLGNHDREIFEGFAFTPADELDRDTVRSPLSPSSAKSSPSHSAFLPPSSEQGNSSRGSEAHGGSHKREMPKAPTAIIGDMRHMPRFWVLTDHGRQQVVLVVRGTMSFNELAADLTCEPEDFEPATMSSPASSKPADDVNQPQTGSTDPHLPLRRSRSSNDLQVPFPLESSSSSSNGDDNTDTTSAPSDSQTQMPGCFMDTIPGDPSPHRWPKKNSLSHDRQPEIRQSHSDGGHAPPQAGEELHEDGASPYQVHGGMLRLARAMGSKGKPVHVAVSAALSKNRGYELVLCGHSLGAGVASLLALMWADPTACRTVPSSGLPSNRRVSVYCFAPPCITSSALSRLCKNLITSIVYSFDVVSRLSLGSIRDLNKAAFWLCEGQGEESTVSLLRRALKGKLGFGGALEDTEDEKKWFIAVRKTLEANMYYSHLFPPGRVWWAVRNEALHPSHQTADVIGTGLRLYDVQQVEEVFRQIEFKGDMLSSHLPHQYDRMLTELEF